jgi:3-phenylpropionate/cinnamic acid dioxygenase small subunit
MMARTHRLANPRAFGAEPAPRTCHIISGVQASADGDTAEATSSQIMLEWRERGNYEADQRLFGGRVLHRFRNTPDGWRIVLKRVDLINATGAFNAMAAPL